MCGRFALTTTEEELRRAFAYEGPPRNLAPRWNIAPTQEVPVVRLAHGVRRLDLLKWGLEPYWAEDPSIASRMINARGETVADKPAFRQAYKSRRCLVPADAFYEWPEHGDGKRPILFRRRPDIRDGGGPFAFAGLWEKWVPQAGGVLETFTIVNCAAGPFMARVHSRTPVVVAPADYGAWLDPAVEPHHLIKPPPDDFFVTTRVSTYVNKTANDDSNCFTPAPDEPPPVAEAPVKPRKKAKPADGRQQSLF
jgi:putative SOS response-associated peptidase YedK